MRYPAPTTDEIADVEISVGFPLPSVLTGLYALRGNGGFGPDYGLLGLGAGHLTDLGDTALSLYRLFSEDDPDDPSWMWPKHLLPILHVGCAIYYCIDLSAPGNPVIQFDPNMFGLGDTWEVTFSEVSPDLEAWLARVVQ